MTTLIRGGLVHDAVHRDACKADILPVSYTHLTLPTKLEV